MKKEQRLPARGKGSASLKNANYHRDQNYYKKPLYKSDFLEATNFVIISIQLKQTRGRPPKNCKNKCFREFFCNNFGQDEEYLNQRGA